MFSLLALPRALEAKFWSAPATKLSFAQLDRWGVATSLLLNFTATKFLLQGKADIEPSTLTRLVLWLAGIAQIVQAIVLCSTRYTGAYNRCRFPVTLLQRATRLLVHVYQVCLCPLTDSYPIMVHGNRQEQDVFRAYLASLLLMPIVGFSHTINFPLSFNLQAAFIMVKACVDMSKALPDTAAVMRQFGHVPQSERACTALDFTVGLLTNMMPPDPETGKSVACGEHSVEFVVSFCYVVVCILAPLHLTFWCERAHKEAFLKIHDATDSASCQPAAQLASGRPTEILMYVLASIIAAWWLCILYAPLCAKLQEGFI